MSIIRLNELPEGSGNLTNDDIFVFMDDPSGSGITKKISLSQISAAIGGGGGGNADTGDITFNGVSIIGSGTGSGDGNNKGTIELVPDNTLYNNDQYLIVDPTAPNHIHLRAGGTQDNSSAQLIIGGEYGHVNITDYNHQVSIRADGGETDTTINLGQPLFNMYGDNVFATEFIPPNGSTITVGDVVYTVIGSWDNTHYGEDKGIYLSPLTPILEYDNYPIHLASIPKSWTFQNDGVLQLANGGIKFNDGSVQNTAATSGLSDSNTYIICKTGDDLAAKYAAAKLLTPGGNALSSTNRATLIIMPGNYNLSEELLINAEFVDILGLGSMKLDRGCVVAVTVTGYDINASANNVRIKGIGTPSDRAFKIDGNKPLQVFEECIGGSDTEAGTFSFGGGNGTASGTFTNCNGGDYSFGGNNGTASGTFANCNGGDYSFGGYNGTASGIFTNCVGGNNSFGGDGGVASGKFISCRLTSGTFPTLSGSGKIRLCIDGNYDVINADVP